MTISPISGNFGLSVITGFPKLVPCALTALAIEILSRIPLAYGCFHNDGGDTTIADLLEHGMSGDLGGIARDIATDSRVAAAVDATIDATKHVMREIGDSMMRESDNFDYGYGAGSNIGDYDSRDRDYDR